MSSSAAFYALTQEITCSLCGSLYHRPHSFAGCGHSFCYTCVTDKLSAQHEGQRICPTCKEAVSVKELYFNHKCQSIVKAVEGLQQILTVGTRIDKENSHGAANAAQLSLANRPSSSHDPATEVSHQEDDINVSLHKSGGVLGLDAQVSHQYGVAPSPNMAQHVTQSASLQQLHSIASAAEPDAQRTSPRLPLEPDAAALQRLHILHKSDARAACPDALANATLAEATMFDLACLGRDKPDLPCPEGLPASLLRYDQAWAASVAALPPPDEAETTELTHELLMIEAVLEDLRKRLKAKGNDAPDMQMDPGLLASPTGAVAQGQPEAEKEPNFISRANNVLDDGLTSKQSRSPDSSDRQQLQPGGCVLPSEMVLHSMLDGTDRSLGDIDAVMQARGYRLSCMPGPSGMPQTFMSCDGEAGLEIEDSPSSHQDLENPSPWPAPVSHDSEVAQTHSPLNAVSTSESQQMGLSQDKAAPAAAEAGYCSRPDVAACAQLVASASLHQPAESMPELLHSCNAVHEQADVPNYDESMAANEEPATADSPAAHTAIPAVRVDMPEAAKQPHLAQAPVGAAAAAAVLAGSSPLQVVEQEGLVLPDSAGPSQQAQTSDGQQPELLEAPASPVTSPITSENASLEAALALASLATGEGGLNTVQTAASLQQSKSPAQERRHRPAQQKQCKSSHMPLKAIQRTAAVQRQPLKPAWQHSSKVTAGWGSKGQRTWAQKATLPQKGRKSKQQQQGSQAADTGTKALVSQVDEDQGLCSEHNTSSKFARTSQAAIGSQQEAGHTGSSSKEASAACLKAVSTQQAEANKAAQGDELTEASGQSQSVLHQSPSKPEAEAAQQDSDDDADDFKPDIRRRPRARTSPQGSRKRARVSAEKVPSSVPIQQEHNDQEDEPIGQALLQWNDAHQQWDHEIITGFSANKGKHCVRGQAGWSHWVDLRVVTWLRSGRPPVQKVLIRQLVNQSVEIWWPEDKKFYKGTVIGYIPDKAKHHVLYDDGEEEDLNMAKEQFQFCPPLPKLEQEQQPGTEPQAQAKARQAISKGADLATASSGGNLVTVTACDHQSGPCDHADPPPNAEEHLVKSCRNPQLDCTEQGHAPQHIMAPTPLQEGSDSPLHAPTGSVANAVGASEAASASQPAADSLPDTHPVSAETREKAQSCPADQLEPPQQQAKPASDAYNYTASGAEATGAHQELLNARTDAQVSQSRGRGSGRKRLPVRQAAAAKRQKRLPSSEHKAARGRKTVKQPAQPPRQATRLAKASSQKLASEDDAPASAAADVAEAGHTNSADQLLQQQEQAAPSQNCAHGELSDKSLLPQQQDPPKQSAAHQLQISPSEQMQQQQLSELAVQPKLPEAPAHVLPPAGHLPQPQTQAAVMSSGKKVVVGSGLDRTKLDQIRRLCRRLRADACKAVDQHTTHVIVQVSAGGLCQQRSLKYFQGLAQGCWLVGWAWLEACAAAGCWVPEEGYEVAGDHVALGAPKAARMADESAAPKLFHGMSFLMGFGYKGTGLSPQQLTELLTYAGGRVLDQLSADLGSKDQVHDTEMLHVILFGEGNIEPDKVRKTKEQTGRWPLLLSWVLDSLSHQTPLPVAQYEERGQLRDTI